MNQIFGATYADAYDLLYLDKNYSTECNLIDKFFHTCGNDSISTVLDLAVELEMTLSRSPAGAMKLSAWTVQRTCWRKPVRS